MVHLKLSLYLLVVHEVIIKATNSNASKTRQGLTDLMGTTVILHAGPTRRSQQLTHLWATVAMPI